MFGLKCVQPKVESREIISYETTVSFHFQTFIADGKDETFDSSLFYEGMLHIVNQFIIYMYLFVTDFPSSQQFIRYASEKWTLESL